MTDYNKLISDTRKLLYSKKYPGEILNDITENKVKEISSRYKHNSNALWLGANLADLYLKEAFEAKDINSHIPRAVEYATQLINDNNISKIDSEIIIEIIKTHHGGEQIHIESKIYKNADCFKFLDIKGLLHLFGSEYSYGEKDFEKAIIFTRFKVEEKYKLVDLDEQLIKEAKVAYDFAMQIFSKLEYKYEIPEIYKPK